MVYYLVKVKGMRLEAAEQEIKKNSRNVSKKQEVIERLEEVRKGLLALEDSLKALQ